MAAFKVPHIIPARQPKPSDERGEPNSSAGAEDSVSVSLNNGEGDEQSDRSEGDSAVEVVAPSTAASQESVATTTAEVSESKESTASASDNCGSVESTSHKEPEAPPPLPYTAPRWGGMPSNAFSLMVVKTGVVVDTVSLEGRSYVVFGRLPTCHVMLEHPSISRYHAVIQYKPHPSESGWQEGETPTSSGAHEPGYYVYDLGSTHGTWLNKEKLLPRVYYRLRIGQMVKFGGSSRQFVLQATDDCQDAVEAEAEQEIEEFTRQKLAAEQARLQHEKEEEERRKKEKERESRGVMWGLDYDFDMESSAVVSTDVDAEREAYYKDDPKRVLKKFFDREGLDLVYETEEIGQHFDKSFNVRVQLPLETPTGEPLYAESTVKGRKKEAIVQCALEACRLLDAYDVLRGNTQAHKRLQKNWEDADYYDSDEDSFLDRTGSIEQKRKQRMKKAGKLKEQAETFESLKTKLENCQSEIAELEKSLEDSKRAEQSSQGEGDSLESFMKGLRRTLSKTAQYEARQKIHHLRKDEEYFLKLINIVKPDETPAFTSTNELKKVTHAPSPSNKPLPAHGPIHKPQPDSKQTWKKVSPKWTNQIADKEEAGSEVALSLKERIERAKQEMESEERRKHCAAQEVAHNRVDCTTQEVSPKEKKAPSRRRSSDSGKDLPSLKKKKIGPTLPPPTVAAREEQGQEDTRDMTIQEKKEDVVTWLPPESQSGDGRTHLNDKFGY